MVAKCCAMQSSSAPPFFYLHWTMEVGGNENQVNDSVSGGGYLAGLYTEQPRSLAASTGIKTNRQQSFTGWANTRQILILTEHINLRCHYFVQEDGEAVFAPCHCHHHGPWWCG